MTITTAISMRYWQLQLLYPCDVDNHNRYINVILTIATAILTDQCDIDNQNNYINAMLPIKNSISMWYWQSQPLYQCAVDNHNRSINRSMRYWQSQPLYQCDVDNQNRYINVLLTITTPILTDQCDIDNHNRYINVMLTIKTSISMWYWQSQPPYHIWLYLLT